MIGKIAGRLEYRADDHVLVDVRGVGYLVFCSDRSLAQLPDPGQAVALYTELLVREDLLQLYGFLTLLEKEWFRLLLTVQGVGAKAALAILGALGAEGTSRAIALGDVAAIKAAKGIGPKTAQRVVIELKDKAPTLMAMGAGAGAAAPIPADVLDAGDIAEAPKTPPKAPATAPAHAQAAAQSEALSALSNLGYAPAEGAAAVAQVATDAPDADTATLIRAALRLLAPKG